MSSTKINQQVSQKLFQQLDYAYVCTDHSLIVQSVSENIDQFGFSPIPQGSDITDHIDFMVGMDTRAEIRLPVMSSPSGKPISVNLLPDENNLTVVIGDASVAFAQRQMLQQAANENELLLDQQQKLMREIELAKQELEVKNQELNEASRLQTSFLSGVSHEFRTPLTSIIGYTNLLNRHFDAIQKEAKRPKDYLSAVRRSSKHLLSLVENLLDHGKLDSDEIVINPKPTQLNQVFDDVAVLLEPLCTTKNIKLSVEHNLLDLGQVFIDDSRLRQCLINLVGNAVKFTDVGGVQVSAHWLDDMLQVRVNDTGLGISEENLEKIKVPFWQAPDTGKAGTGLGLTITDRIIELMGGGLNIESQLHKGTTVSFDMAAPRIDTQQSISSEAVAVQNKSLHILLAEDDSDIADLVILMLQEKGVEVTHVQNGALAIDLVSEGDFDLILMDIHMPVVDGYEAIESIRANGDKTPIIVMSASPVESDDGRAQELGCDGYLVKPVDVSDIIKIANQIT